MQYLFWLQASLPLSLDYYGSYSCLTVYWNRSWTVKCDPVLPGRCPISSQYCGLYIARRKNMARKAIRASDRYWRRPKRKRIKKGKSGGRVYSRKYRRKVDDALAAFSSRFIPRFLFLTLRQLLSTLYVFSILSKRNTNILKNFDDRSYIQ